MLQMKTILVIEDNTEIRENTVELLQLSNYRVVAAVNGQSGLEMAKKHLPDLILCDMMMPGTDGQYFMTMAKNDKKLRQIPLVFFSAGSPMPEVQKVLIRVANGYLKKPFTEEDLLEIITRALGKTQEAPDEC